MAIGIRIEPLKTSEPRARLARSVCACGGSCWSCLPAQFGNRGLSQLVARVRDGAGKFPNGVAHPHVDLAIAAACGGGRALDAHLADQLGASLGTPLGDVRVAYRRAGRGARSGGVSTRVHCRRRHLLRPRRVPAREAAAADGGIGDSAVAIGSATGEVSRSVRARRVKGRALQRSPGSPAGGCGVCYGSARHAGIAAHAIIGAAFARFYGDRVIPEFPFLAPSPGDDNGRVDLVMPTADGYDIGEINSANAAGLLAGDRDLLWYEMQIRRLFNMRVGRMTLPPPPISLTFPISQAGCPAQALFVERWPEPAGIYTY